jgi:hypothetical protein
MFVFSTNTNNVPASTNYIMAVGPNGLTTATDTLYNISTYGVGYLPCTFSTLNGEIISVGNLVLAGGVTPAQLTSVQTALQSSISTTQGSVDTLSSYVLLDVIPSTVSTFNSYVSSLNSSFAGYVAGTTVTGADLASTYTAATLYTDGQVSTLSTAIGLQICTLSNYFDVSTATLAEFNSLCTTVSVQSNYFSLQMYVLGSNFNALSTSTRLLNESNSTLVGEFETDVSSLSGGLSTYLSSLEAEVIYLSSITTDPLATLGLLSTSATANWPFFSNIKVSSIDVRAAGTALAPAISFTSGGDSDTGFFHPADGAIAITTNSGERFRFAGTQLIGCNSDIRLFGSNSGGINAYANSTEPNMQLYTASLTSSVAFNMCNANVSFTTYLTKPTGAGFIANNQLITYAFPGSNPAIAIHSTGNVAIKAAATTSNALYVGGSTFIGGQLGVGAAGTAAAPALYFSEADNDTGFFKPGDGLIGIATNSSERFRFSVGGLTGYDADIVLNGIAGQIKLLPNSFTPQINLNTTNPLGNPLISWSNTAVKYETILTGNSFNQLNTYVSGYSNPVIAMNSNGTVGIRTFANSSFALTVNGGIRQTAPYIWSFGPTPAGTPYNFWINPPVDIPGPITPSPYVGGFFTVPYDGLYTIDLSYYYLLANTTSGLPITVSNITAGTTVLYTNQAMSIVGNLFGQSYGKRTVNLTSNHTLGVWALVAGGNAFSNLYWTIQYWG